MITIEMWKSMNIMLMKRPVTVEMVDVLLATVTLPTRNLNLEVEFGSNNLSVFGAQKTKNNIR